MSRAAVSRAERGHLDELTLAAFRRVTAALDLRVDLVPRWRGGELDRMLSRGHSLLHEAFARHLGTYAGWTCRPEVSYSIFGERGVIDMLAWHADRAMVLVVEFKTELIDVNDLVATMDRRRRLAIAIAQDFKWRPVSASSLVVLVGDRTNRRRVTEHRTLLRAAFPADGRRLAGWLRDPGESVAMLAMWPDERQETSRPGGRPLEARVGRPSARGQVGPRTNHDAPGG